MCGYVAAHLLYFQTAVASDWLSYQNPRFGTMAHIPAQGFAAQPPSANGDGRIWVAQNGQGEFRVFGAYMLTVMNFAALQSIHKQYMLDDGIKLTYAASGTGWFVLSGIKDNVIHYQKYVFNRSCSHAIVDGFTAQYARTASGYFEPIVTHISHSLKGSQGGFGC